MTFSETLENLKNKLPSQYRENVIDYKTLKSSIDEVVKKINKTGIYDIQAHSHLIMENDMKTNIDNHIRETFRKNKIVVDDNSLIEIFDDNNVITPIDENNSPTKQSNGPKNILSASPIKETINDTSSIDSIYEKNINYNFKEKLEREVKKSQVNLVKFINNAKDKEEIIKGLSLKYYQIFYAMRECENLDGKREIKSSIVVSISKIIPNDLDVQKLLDEITGQNTELFENEETEYSNNNEEKIEEEKIDQAHLEMIRESLKAPEVPENINCFNNMVDTPENITPVDASRKNSNNLVVQNDIDMLRLSHSPINIKFDEHMLGKNQRQDSNDSNISDPKKSPASSYLANEDDDDYDDDDVFQDDDDDVDIILPSTSSKVPKEKEIEPDPIAVKGDNEEMIKTRASIIQKRLSMFNCDDDGGISKEKFMSLFNNKNLNAFRNASQASHSSYEGKLSLSSSMQNMPEFEQPGSFYSVESNVSNTTSNHNYWEIPVYSYYTYSVIPEDQRIPNIPQIDEPEPFELELDTNETAEDSSGQDKEEIKIVSLVSRQSSYAENSPEAKIVNPVRMSETPLFNRPYIDNLYSHNSTTAILSFADPLPIKEKRRKSLSNLFKKSKSYNDNIMIEGNHSYNSKLADLNKRSTSIGIIGNNNNNSIYVRKTKSHSFSYHFKNPFKKMSSRKNSMSSNTSLSRVMEGGSTNSNPLNYLDHVASMSKNTEKRIEILLESDTSFLNNMITILKDLSAFEKNCRNLFDTNINATKKLLNEVSAPGKLDTYPWRNLNRLYRETDLWTHNGKVNTWQQATDKLELFKIKSENFTKKFKMEDSTTVFNQFLKLNQDAITLKQFYEINQTAIYMVLKDHDRDTKLNACEGLPFFISTDFFSDNTCKRFTYEISHDLLSIIPDAEKYSCPICQELAYKPIRLNCNHLFCLKCLIKAQKKNLDNCPVCRAQDAVKNATSKNLDKKLLNTLTNDFPREIRARKRQLKEMAQQQELEDAREMTSHPGSFKESEEDNCIIM